MNYRYISDIPENQLFQFDYNKYVWRIKLNSTRAGNYPSKNPFVFTEVYEKGDGVLNCIASGLLRENIYRKEFSIFDYDQDTNCIFGVTIPLKEAGKEILLMLRENISQINNSRSK